LLDDRDNPWLDEAIIRERTTMNRPRPSHSEMKKKDRKGKRYNKSR